MRGIRVAVRVRPRVGDESTSAKPHHTVAVHADPAQGTVSVDTSKSGDAHSSRFDVVLGPESTQLDCYGVVADAIEDVTAGINVSVIAYGQTGSGKTHTMLGDPSSEDGAGIIPRAVRHLFALLTAIEAEAEETRAAAAAASSSRSPSRSPIRKHAASSSSTSKSDAAGEEHATAEQTGEPRAVATVACSYLQLYNEQVLDLLQNGRDARPLAIHERKRGKATEVFVRGLSEVR